MFKHASSRFTNDRLRDSFSRPVGSLRTRYSIATAAFLLVGLAFFYYGGQHVFTNLLNDASEQFRQVGSDISLAVLRHDEHLARSASSFMQSLRLNAKNRCPPLSEVVTHEEQMTQNEFGGASLAVRFTADGGPCEGCYRIAGQTFALKEEMAPYHAVLAGWRARLEANIMKKPPIGIIRIQGIPHYVAMTKLDEGGYLLVGRRFVEKLFLLDMRSNLRGFEVTSIPTPATVEIPEGAGWLAPLVRLLSVHDDKTAAFDQAAFAMVDVLGKPVSVISVRLPRSFSHITVLARGRYSLLITLAGILMVVPIFWLQGRLLLDPLSRMTRAVTELANRRMDIDCPRLDWKGRDELAQLAAAFNHMLETISARTVSIANLERSHQAFINGFPDSITVFDARGHLVSITKEAEGVDPIPGLAVGEPPDGTVFGHAEVDRFVTLVAETLADGRVGQAHLKVQRPKGVPRDFPTRHFEVRLARMDEHFVLAFIRDVSQEVAEHKLRLEAERRGMDTKKRASLTNLAAGIAHDMNNVLSIVLNAAEAADADPSGDSAKSLGAIRDAVSRGTAMMRELQTFAGDNHIEFKRASPRLVIDDTMLLASRLVGPNISLTYEVDPTVPDIDLDPNQFWKVLFNILKNASEAIGSSPGRIRVRAIPFTMTPYDATNFYSEHPLPSGPGALFCIEDDGDGIAPEFLDRLFDPYVSSKAVGRGLGLATVRTIVEAHSGGIRVKSALNVGTTFLIFLPASKASQTVRTLRPELPPRPNIHATARDVLVVDNDEPLLKTTALLLRSLKLNVHVARDRREALAIVRHHTKRLGVILLDAHLGGTDTVRLLGAFRIGAPNVPVVVTSGSAEEEMHELFSPHPYDAFLPKPYTIAELRGVLEKAMRKSV